MDSCLKLVSCALNAILKWAHLHNKQSCEKDLAAVHWLSDLVLVSAFGSIWISRISNWISFQLFSKPMKEQFFLSENPMFEICSNGFSHFKLSQNGCKSSSLVNEHENVKIEFQIPVGRVFFFFRKKDNIKSLNFW